MTRARPTHPAPGRKLSSGLQAQTAAYPLGFPVTVRLQARNTGTAPLAVVDRLSPEYAVVRIETRAEGSDEWRAVQPLFTLEPLGDESAMLEPGAATSQSIEIFYGDAGWTFARPGRYEVRARMSLAKADEEVRSQPVPIVISAPAVAADVAALQPLLDDEGRLDEEVGRYLAFHGRIRADAARRRVSTLIDDHPQTALGAALRLTAGAQALRAPIDPATGRRAAADLATARGLLAGVCRESGLMALGRRLLRTAEASAAAEELDRAAAEADEVAAWEGARPPGAAAQRLAYGDPALEPMGPIRFEKAGTALDEAAKADVRRIAETLRDAGHAAVLVVGHTDAAGDCTAADAIGLERAESVARELRRAGIGEAEIEVASLGFRRPLDFSSGDVAAALNRRVEVLVRRDDRE